MRFTAIISLILALAGFSQLHSEATKKVLIVVTNHAVLGETGVETGYFLSEVAHPWQVFTEAGYSVEFASPTGGYAPMDPKSFDLEDPINREFWHTLSVVEKVFMTQDLSTLDLEAYAAIFFAGGHGTMWDFAESDAVARSIETVYARGGVVGAVCHGPAALLKAEIDGKPLVHGKRVAGFTNAEESAVELTDAVPFLLETELRALGAEFVAAENFQTNVVVDGRLVTGQNPASAEKSAEAIVGLLSDE